MTVALEPHEEAWLAEEAAELRRLGHEAVLLDARSGARGGALAALSRAACGSAAAPASCTRRSSPGGCGGSRSSSACALFEGSRVTRPGGGGRGTAGRDHPRRGERPRRGADDRRLPVAGARGAAADRPRLGLRPDERATRRRAARVGRLGEPPGDRRRRQPVPLLPADRGRQDHVGRLRRASTASATASGRTCDSATRRSPGSRSTSSRRSRSSRACGSRTAGAGRSTRAAASRRSSAPHTAAGSATPPGTPGWGSGRAASAPAWRSTCWRGADTEATALRYVRTRPVPFPPEPLRWAVIELTRNRLAAADRRQGRRGAWLRLLDRLGLGFDS